MREMASLLSTPCDLNLPLGDHPFYTLLCVIQRARLLLHAVGRSVQLLVYCNMVVHLVLVLGNTVLLPPVLAGNQTLWLVFVTIPLLAAGVIHTRQVRPGSVLNNSAPFFWGGGPF